MDWASLAFTRKERGIYPWARGDLSPWPSLSRGLQPQWGREGGVVREDGTQQMDNKGCFDVHQCPKHPLTVPHHVSSEDK